MRAGYLAQRFNKGEEKMGKDTGSQATETGGTLSPRGIFFRFRRDAHQTERDAAQGERAKPDSGQQKGQMQIKFSVSDERKALAPFDHPLA